MRYALLFRHAPATAIPEADREAAIGAMIAEMRGWTEELSRAGVLVATLRLPSEAATTLRTVKGETPLTDGPFAESKEIVGGLALIECASREEALRWARRCPLLRIGAIELRPEEVE